MLAVTKFPENCPTCGKVWDIVEYTPALPMAPHLIAIDSMCTSCQHRRMITIEDKETEQAMGASAQKIDAFLKEVFEVLREEGGEDEPTEDIQ
jgi:C4-type Zn-finger protein